MKTFAIVLVSAVVLYAIYELFSNNAGLSTLFGRPGQITPAGTSVPGVPIYSNVATPSNNTGLAIGAATTLAASVIPTEVSDAFGPSELGSSYTDVSDATAVVSGSDLADFASGSGSDDF